MNQLPPIRFFRLSQGGVECDEHGLRVAGVRLLERDLQGNWTVRDDEGVCRELSRVYGVPLDISAKRNGLEVVAKALQRGETARAQIAALLLKLPDPPQGKAFDIREQNCLATALDLAACGLLKADPEWDAKHPRTGTPPNPGYFAPVPKDQLPERPAGPKPGWPPKAVNTAVREWLKTIVGKATSKGGQLLVDFVPVVDAFATFFEALGVTPTNMYEVRLEQQVNAYFSTPKTLEELQQPPAGDPLGYERHHIVEQNDANIAKGDLEHRRELLKFGAAAINDDSNIVWIPRIKHEDVTTDYNSWSKDVPSYSRLRDYVNTLDFAQQREFGLQELRKNGVLQ